MDPPVLDLVKRLERWITAALIWMLLLVVVLSTIELGYTIYEDIVAPPFLFFPGIDRLLDIFGRLLLVVIGIELLETLRALSTEGLVRLEIVLTVAVIALARKIIVLEIGRVTSAEMAGIAVLLVALAAAYWAFVRHLRSSPSPRRLIRRPPRL
jgi:uncharacterized membrane protein (DUF373 family)